VSVIYITESALASDVCFGKVRSETRPDQLITFTRCLCQAVSIEYGHVPPAAPNQPGPFQLSGSIRDGRPVHAQHLGEEGLSDLQCVIVTAVSIINNQRASRCLTLWVPLQATDTRICWRKAWR